MSNPTHPVPATDTHAMPKWVTAALSDTRDDASHGNALASIEAAALWLADALDKAAHFKAYVHGRLDAAGIPHDPDPEHTKAEGCRIGGRLDYVFSALDKAQRERDWILSHKAVHSASTRIPLGGGHSESLFWHGEDGATYTTEGATLASALEGAMLISASLPSPERS